MANLSVFLPWIETACETVPRPLALAAARSAAERFCRIAGVWSAKHPDISVYDGVAEYALVIPPGAQIIRIDGVHYEGEALTPADPLWGSQYEGDSPQFVYWLDVDSFVPAPVPDYINGTLLGTLELFVFYAPAADATTVPDFLYESFESAIISGALSRLLAMPGKSWTDVKLSQFEEEKFRRACGNAKVRAATGNTTSLRAPVYTGYFG